jgi:hypothetical protein
VSSQLLVVVRFDKHDHSPAQTCVNSQRQPEMNFKRSPSCPARSPTCIVVGPRLANSQLALTSRPAALDLTSRCGKGSLERLGRWRCLSGQSRRRVGVCLLQAGRLDRIDEEVGRRSLDCDLRCCATGPPMASYIVAILLQTPLCTTE